MEKSEWPAALLRWFDANRRDLPWRESKPRDPYHVWISEIMLQQTRTEAVKPYFNAWMERFPHISDLAAAEEDEVLHAWQGLGYYSRARNIHRAAREIAEKYGGKMPKEPEVIRSLPGIGRPSPMERKRLLWMETCSVSMPASTRWKMIF